LYLALQVRINIHFDLHRLTSLILRRTAVPYESA
jgi:hypothetical protein